MKAKETVLITGATGFLGSYVARACLAEGYHVCALRRKTSNFWRVRDIANRIDWYGSESSLERPFKRTGKIHHILHTATCYGRRGEHAADIIKTNLLFSLELLETAMTFHAETFINTDSLLSKYVNSYALSKKQFVEWLKMMSDRIRCVNMKIEHIYGPKDDAGKFVIWLMSRMLEGDPDIRLTEGTQHRDFIYITDVVKAYMLLLRSIGGYTGYTDIDVGTGHFIPVRTFVEKIQGVIAEIAGREIRAGLHFGALPYREADYLPIKEDLSRLYQLGWDAEVSLETGLRATIQWLLENQEQIR